MEIASFLRDSLETGFILKEHESYTEYQPQLVLNDKRIRTKILSSLIRELQHCEGFIFSVAFLTTSGVAVLFNQLEALAQKRVRGKILVSQYQNFTQPEALRRLKQFSNVDLRIVTHGNFHAKGYIFQHATHYNLIVGSSNLTANALTSNKEWNLRVTALKSSKIIHDALEAFNAEFEQAEVVDEDFIVSYQRIFDAQRQFVVLQSQIIEDLSGKIIEPNRMQEDALNSLAELRSQGKSKALLISATGTGKTYLSAFDVQKFKPKRLLFLVHRRTIASKAKESYQRIFRQNKTMGMFSGEHKEVEPDFIFSTIQTMGRDENLKCFDPQHFDYIVIDETHRAGAETYQRILRHFKPKFLLGMTATPERTDGFDIFNQFDYNIAYEIRLHHALEEEMLCPFHYYGITDIEVNEAQLDEESTFLKLVSEERVRHIIERSQLYGSDDGQMRCLVFCNSNRVSTELAKAFRDKGFRALSLSGSSSEREREEAIVNIESDDPNQKLDYLFTVDIFNEGVDIPRVNQIIMLRPTQSAIVFVQQLGRGLRKAENKEYLTVIDFIGNYSNNYLVPIALYGDESYNKDTLRKLIAAESDLLPGASTVNFDRIAKERIYSAIDSAKMNLKKDLVNDYNLLKYKLGHIPSMMDFIEHGSREPFLYVETSKSYHNFVAEREPAYAESVQFSREHQHILELISKEIANGKRVEEVLMLKGVIPHGNILVNEWRFQVNHKFGYLPSPEILESTVKNLNLLFITENSTSNAETGTSKKVKVGEKYGYQLVEIRDDRLFVTPWFASLLLNESFEDQLKDVLRYGEHTFSNGFEQDTWINGFVLYRKYTRKDVFRLLNWEENPVAQNVGGYIVSKDKKNCPAFVNYHKAIDISTTTKYEDMFINNRHFVWISKAKRKLSSPDVLAITSHKELNMRIPLFVKKSNDEGQDFYYLGDLNFIEGKAEEIMMDDGKTSAVRMEFMLSHPVEMGLYRYLTMMDK
jgi:superfamily II DNA or RNA helicase/HKD family nuclease